MPSSNNKRRKPNTATVEERSVTAASPTGSDGGKQGDFKVKAVGAKSIELLDNLRKIRRSWPTEMSSLFDPSLPDDRRNHMWEIMCEAGDSLRQRFAWAVPDEQALRIIKHFGPIVEIGSGLGYWAMLLRDRGVDVNAYDKTAGSPDGGKTLPKQKHGKEGEKPGASGCKEGEPPSFWTKVEEGGPEVLEETANEKRSLLLCYPDDFEGETESLGLRCIHAFEGDVVIHIGELFGDSISMNPMQSPWGRTTSQDCQEELVSNFHCILKVPLPSWPHSRDTLTVWKRHTFSTIHYEESEAGDEEGDGDRAGSSGEAQPQKRDREQKHASGASSTSKISGVTADPGGREEGSSRGKKRGDDDDDDDEDGASDDGGSSFDEDGSLEGLPIGIPDVDMYAFVPEDERISVAQAAPNVSFLLDAAQ